MISLECRGFDVVGHGTYLADLVLTIDVALSSRRADSGVSAQIGLELIPFKVCRPRFDPASQESTVASRTLSCFTITH